MTSLDILFWLIAALLGGLVWAVETGLAARHRNVVLSSMAATLSSMLFLMFWVEDKTQLVPLEAHKFAKNQGGGGGGSQDDSASGGRGGGGDGHNNSSTSEAGQDGQEGQSGDSGGNAARSAAGDKDGHGGSGGGTGQAARGVKAAGADSIEYSRVPFKDCPSCPDLVIIPKGTAKVGAGADSGDREPGEQSATVVPVPNPLAVGRLEITRREFSAFAEDTGFPASTACDVGKRRGVFNWRRPGIEQDERHPIVCIAQPEVQLYLAWLSGKTGRAYRLPTEVEWEYAARAGTQTPYSMGVTVSGATANVARSRDGTTVGGLLAANPWGLSDMVGNVWEMTSNCGVDLKDGPQGRSEDCIRLVKGGSWLSTVRQARHAARRFVRDGVATHDVGFRVVREVDERDNDKILTVADKRALVQADKDAAEIEAKARQEVEELQRKKFEEAEAAEAKKAAASAKK